MSSAVKKHQKIAKALGSEFTVMLKNCRQCKAYQPIDYRISDEYSIYESQAIPYYLIISPDTEEVEVYKIRDGIYSLEQKGNNFSYQFSLGDCTATIDFKEIW